MDNGRKTAFQILLEVEKEKAFSNLTANRIIRENAPENPAFVRELVYGVLANKLLIDYYLDLLIPSGIKKVGDREKTILRIGVYQIKFMESVPAYAAVNETVAMAKRLVRGREGFINGVLRSYVKQRDRLKLPQGEKDEYFSVKYSFPRGIIKLWKEQYGEDCLEDLLAASNERPKLCVRVNTLRTHEDSLAASLEKKGFAVEKGKLAEGVLYISGSGAADTEEYRSGLFSIQDEASAMVCRVLGPKPGDTVIDTCAAPGGKTAAMGEMMENRGRIIACDVYTHRLALIEKQAERLGVSIVETRLLDGTEGDDSLTGSADKVLADVPCSGLGVIRRKPEIKYKENEDFSDLIDIQERILDRASRYVKNGGLLVYSTCTINKEENDMQIKKFIENHNEYEIIYEKQFMPTEGTDGFFMCKMKKKGK